MDDHMPMVDPIPMVKPIPTVDLIPMVDFIALNIQKPFCTEALDYHISEILESILTTPF